jgi:uncharacterized membrane protein HdeD (DUF308 family)
MQNWKDRIKKISDKNPALKTIIGVALIIYGLLALFTPFTPGSWLIVVGLELLGVHWAIWDNIKAKLKKKKS